MLYIVGTPIGNLGEITYRAVETLKNVDVIAAEDTRRTMVLLNAYGIKKPLISYQKFNEQATKQKLTELLLSGKDVALVSDAGMPLISDPGYVFGIVFNRTRDRIYGSERRLRMYRRIGA